MMKDIRYGDKMDLIRKELLKCAEATPMEFPTYSQFGSRVGIPSQGPWKPVLDAISRNETSEGLPDITFVLVKQSTGYPGQIGFVRSNVPTAEQKALARNEIQKVIDKYNSGARNPF